MPAVIESYKKLIQAGDLPPLSEAGLEILRLGERDDLSASQLVRVISKDPALAAKVLRIANSPFYGLRTQVKTLEHAIVVLGQVSIVSICAASALVGGLKTSKAVNHERYELKPLRGHAVLTAILARWLAQHGASSQVPMSGVFLGGLLHDIGELAIAIFYPQHLKEIGQYEQEHPDASSYQAEQAILGFDHQELGAEVLSHWHLPQLYIDIAGHHHDATCAVHIGEETGMLLQAADQLAGVFKDDFSHVITSGKAQQEELPESWIVAISMIQDLAPGIEESLEKDMEGILEEARVMIE